MNDGIMMRYVLGYHTHVSRREVGMKHNRHYIYRKDLDNQDLWMSKVRNWRESHMLVILLPLFNI